jgi:alpha-tubulin suppressor-like RCC1 family protein
MSVTASRGRKLATSAVALSLLGCSAAPEPDRDGGFETLGVQRSTLITDPPILDLSRCGQPGVICVNFQERGNPVPAGYLPDFGDTFGARNGQSYGWSADTGCFDRNKFADQRLDTSCRMQPNTTWEIALPNGAYEVRAVIGDANSKARATLLAEGQGVDEEPEEFWRDVVLPTQKFVLRSIRVFVADGRLTLFSGLQQTPLDFVEIAPFTTPPPAPPFNASAIRKVCTGTTYSTALLTNGTVWTWGTGALGDGLVTPHASPKPVPRLSNVVDVDCEQSRTVAADAAGSVWEWGEIETVSFGVGGSSPETMVPGRVADIGNIVQVRTTNFNTVALDNTGRLWTWGINFNGQLGNGTTEDNFVPKQVKVVNGFTKISTAFGQSIALKSDGTPWIAGNLIADGGTASVVRFTQVPGLTNIRDVAAGGNYALVVRADGAVLSAGVDDFGKLCNGDPIQDQFFWAPISTVRTYVAGVITIDANMLTRSNGSLWSCGFNLNGTLGDSTTTNRSSAVPVDALTGIRSIDGSTEFTLLSRTDGSLWAWGSNSGGQFGDGTTGGSSLVPRRIF